MSVSNTITIHLRSQARRLGFAGVATVLAALILYGHVDGQVGVLPAPLAIALFYGAAVILTGLVTTYYLPRIRRLIEAIAVTRLALACCVVAVPELGPQLAAAPFAHATLMVGGAIVLLATAPALGQLCATPRAPVAVQVFAAGAQEGVRWLDRGRPDMRTRPTIL